MKIPICSVFLLLVNCVGPDPREARAKQLFREIDEIVQKPVDGQHSEELEQAMIRLYEAKQNFPAGRSEIIADAKIGKEFFTAAIDGHYRVIAKFEELLTLNLAKSKVDCIEIGIKTHQARIKMLKNTLNELELFFHESILDKKTLDLRSSDMRKETDILKQEEDALEKERRDLCSKSALGVD